MFHPSLFPILLKTSALFTIALLCQVSSSAQGDLLIFPKRVVFDGSRTYQDLTLSNSGTDTARYVISVTQIRMNEDGSFTTISSPDSGQRFADPYFRYFPRAVVLAPNESQTVKVQVMRYAQLQSGEYRSHLYFRAEKETAPLGEETKRPDSLISIRLTPVFGISIPVIIRAGETILKIKFSEISVSRASHPMLNFVLNRSGNISMYGDLTVDYISEEGSPTRVATLKGVGIYTPNSRRRFSVPLSELPSVDFNRGSLHIVYTETSGKTVKIAQEQFFLN